MGNTRNLGDLLNTDSTIATADVADGGITTAKLANTAVTTAKIGADAVDGTKIADNAIDTEHYTNGSIGTVKLTDNVITTAKLADDAVTTAKIADDVAISTTGTIATSADLTVGGSDFFVDTSADKVGIGTSTANELHQKLTIYSSAEAGIQFQNNATGVTNSTDGCRISVFEDDIQYTNYETAGKHIFNGGSGTASRLEIEADGDVNVKTGNLVIGTSGKGIDFSAQSGTNNVPTGDGTANPTSENEVLQYYEHGTFSPKPTASGCTFSYQGAGNAYGSGHYTRIGDMVFIDINLDSGSGVTGSTGNAITVTNLPFSGNTGCTLNGGQYFYRRVSDSSYPFIACQQYGTAISFLQMPAQGVWRDLPASQVSFVDHRWKIAGCYHIGSI
tara:strand:- start:306 stop:1472 length:1167 start_codon:yes stop_codon:yes gene_type:complete